MDIFVDLSKFKFDIHLLTRKHRRIYVYVSNIHGGFFTSSKRHFLHDFKLLFIIKLKIPNVEKQEI